jgi:6,7-dimethyl-8-ribityllumazine synthase
MHFLIVISNFYKDLAKLQLDGAIAELKKAGHTHQKISVPGSLEIPAVISYAADSDIYDGFVALGSIIRGETIHYEVISTETTRSLNELAINLNLAIGNGIISAENKAQALERADQRNKGGAAANVAIHMAIIKNKFSEVAEK